MKVLQIGVGRWGVNHLRVLKMLNVDLYVSDTSGSAYKECEKAGVPRERFSADWREFLSEVDAVDVVTPLDSHVPICSAALKAGKAVFVEKPVAATVDDAKLLHDIAQDTKGYLQIGHIFRFDSGTTHMREFIDAGHAGAIRWIYGEFSGFKRPRNDAGVAWSDAIHFVDLCSFLTKKNPDKVHARMLDMLGRGKDDFSIIHLDYGDTFAEIKANYFYPLKKREFVVVGEKATLFCDFTSSQDKIRVYKNSHILDAGSWKAVEGDVIQQEVPVNEPLYEELKAFLELSSKGKPSPVGTDVGIQITRVMTAAYESAKTGKTVRF